MPRMHSANCHMISGRSGEPKFRQSVIATGRPPDTATLRAASATACLPPSYGSRKQYKGLTSDVIASARPVPFTRTMAASRRSGFASVFVHTVEVEAHAGAGAAGHLERRRRQPRRPHVLDADDRVGGHDLEAGLEQQLLGERIADLHGRALLLRGFVELGGGHRRAVNPVAS